MPKILVADDSITVRKVAERLLTEAGLEVTLAGSGEEAVSCLQRERPDFIISDVIMPDKSGYEVCRFVRAHADLSTTPVLLISGVVNEEVTRQAESCRADGVLKKPFQGTSLKDRVLELLAKRRQELAPAMTAAPAPAAPPSEPASGKVFRITEQQLETFKRASARIRELEAELAEARATPAPVVDSGPMRELESAAAAERARAARVAAELEDARARVGELERASTRLEAMERELTAARREAAALTDTRERLTAAERQVEAAQARTREVEAALAEMTRRDQAQGKIVVEHERRLAEAESRLTELAAQLAAERARTIEIAAERDAALAQAAQVAQLEERLESAERQFVEEQARTAMLRDQVAAAALSQEQARHFEEMLAAERARNSELADEVPRLEARLAEMDALLIDQRERATKLAHEFTRLRQSDARIEALERALLEEQGKSAEWTTRLSALEEATTQANARAQNVTQILAQIAALAGHPEPPAGHV